jgi:hypothetical protein
VCIYIMFIYLLTTIMVLDIFLEINQDISSSESTSVLVQHKTGDLLILYVPPQHYACTSSSVLIT